MRAITSQKIIQELSRVLYKEWDHVGAMLDNAENEVPAGEAWTMVAEEGADSIEQDLPTPEQLVNIFTVGSIDGSTKLYVVPECRGLVLKNHHVCKFVKIMGIGNEYWCKNCTSIGNIIDADQDLLLELYCHKGRQEVRKASLLSPLGSFPIVARRNCSRSRM